MSSQILVYDEDWQGAVARLVASSSKSAEVILQREMAAVIGEIIAIMPPASGGFQGRDATVKGRAAVKRDILSMYGTPSDAHEILRARDPLLAKAFWRNFSQGNLATARILFHAADGRSFEAFDGGKLHGRFAGKRKSRKGEKIYFVTDKKPLMEFVRETQKHVYWLAAGWGQAARNLGAKIPAAVSAHTTAPGAIKREITSDFAEITATNLVKYAADVKDVTRRVQWALDKRTGSLNRAFQEFVTKKAAAAGFQTSNI